MKQSPPSADDLAPEHAWPLQCPLDPPEPLHVFRRARTGRVGLLACPAGHRFDAAKQGYVNLLVGRGSPSTPDTSAMIMARERVQEAGVFSELTVAANRIRHRWSARPDDLVLDCGAGTGHHLRHLLAHHPGARGIAVDLSPAGLRRAAQDPRVLALAWDLWRRLPVADASVNLLLNVFAPRNVLEYARVLAPGAAAIVVTPRDGHLAELSHAGMLSMRAGKLDELTDQMCRQFRDPVEHHVVTSKMPIRPELAADLVLMGPAGHHREAVDVAAGLSAVPVEFVTVDLDLTVWVKDPR